MSEQLPAAGAAAEASVLNLGCGEDYRENAHNVDIAERVRADEYVDLEQPPWPWDTDAFETIVANHILEHLDPVPWDELQRVLAPGGRLIVRYPIGHTRFEDPTHAQFWNVNTAAALAGERKHAHEAPLDRCCLVHTSVEWSASDPLVSAYVRVRATIGSVGPWLGQLPGVFGHVRAVYQLEVER